jgi:hypothetical protein
MAKTVWVRAGAKESEQDQQQGPWRSLRILLPVGDVSALSLGLATLPRVMPRLAALRVQPAAQGGIAPVSFPSHYS